MIQIFKSTFEMDLFAKKESYYYSHGPTY
jgi:hypothetical protein